MSTVISNLTLAQQEIIQSFDLKTRAGSPDSLVTEILTWTGHNLLLTKYLCQIIADNNYFIPSGMEAALVEKSVQEGMIDNWQAQSIAPHLKQIQEYFFTQSESFSQALLLIYSQIWHQGSIILNHSQETEELIRLGLIVEEDNYFKVSNRIYQSIFNADWVQQQSFALKIMKANPLQRKTQTSPKKTFLFGNLTPFDNAPIVQILTLISLLGLGIIFPLLVFFNNSQPEFSSDNEIEKNQ